MILLFRNRINLLLVTQCSHGIIKRSMAATTTSTTMATFKRLTPTPAIDGDTPISRSSHGVSALLNDALNKTRIVIYGGEHVARTPIADSTQSLWVAESTTNSDGGWKWINPKQDDQVCSTEIRLIPPWRVAHSQSVVGDTVYIFGGRAGIDMKETAMNDMWKLELTDDSSEAKWTEVKQSAGDNNNIPEERSFHKMITIGTNLYMFGGVGGSGRLNDLWKFDTLTEKWTSLGSSILRGRGGPNILSLSEGSTTEDDVKIAIVAGFAGEETNDGHVYNKDKWEEKVMEGLDDLRKRSVCSFGSVKSFSFLFGGEVDPSNKGHEGAGGFANDLVILDGVSGKVVENIKQPMEGGIAWPEARGWADASIVGDDTFYLFGGLSGNDVTPKRLDDLWECKISKS